MHMEICALCLFIYLSFLYRSTHCAYAVHGRMARLSWEAGPVQKRFISLEQTKLDIRETFNERDIATRYRTKTSRSSPAVIQNKAPFRAEKNIPRQCVRVPGSAGRRIAVLTAERALVEPDRGCTVQCEACTGRLYDG